MISSFVRVSELDKWIYLFHECLPPQDCTKPTQISIGRQLFFEIADQASNPALSKDSEEQRPPPIIMPTFMVYHITTNDDRVFALRSLLVKIIIFIVMMFYINMDNPHLYISLPFHVLLLQIGLSFRLHMLSISKMQTIPDYSV
jgi:flagellar biosynthesis protein FliP